MSVIDDINKAVNNQKLSTAQRARATRLRQAFNASQLTDNVARQQLRDILDAPASGKKPVPKPKLRLPKAKPTFKTTQPKKKRTSQKSQNKKKSKKKRRRFR